MQRVLYSIVCLLMLNVTITSGQQWNFGINGNLVPMKVNGTENYGTTTHPDYGPFQLNLMVVNFQANAGFDYTAVQLMDDKLALGVNLNVAMGYFLNPRYEGLNGAFTIDVPAYITLRHGLRSANDNSDDFGLGFGLGYNYEIMPFPLGSPNLFVDFTFNEVHFIKISYDLVTNKFYNYLSSEGYVPVIEYRQIGLQYGFTI